MESMRLSVFPTVQAPTEARRGVASFADRLDQDSLSDVRTVVSELVTISVASGALRPIDVNLDLVDEEIRGEVDDRGPGTRALLRAGERKDDSLVLRIVDGLVDDWGPNRDRTGIWFRLNVRLRSKEPV